MKLDFETYKIDFFQFHCAIFYDDKNKSDDDDDIIPVEIVVLYQLYKFDHDENKGEVEMADVIVKLLQSAMMEQLSDNSWTYRRKKNPDHKIEKIFPENLHIVRALYDVLPNSLETFNIYDYLNCVQQIDKKNRKSYRSYSGRYSYLQRNPSISPKKNEETGKIYWELNPFSGLSSGGSSLGFFRKLKEEEIEKTKKCNIL